MPPIGAAIPEVDGWSVGAFFHDTMTLAVKYDAGPLSGAGGCGVCRHVPGINSQAALRQTFGHEGADTWLGLDVPFVDQPFIGQHDGIA